MGGIIRTMQQVTVGDWWTIDGHDHEIAHRVGAVIPDLVEPSPIVTDDYLRWIPLCACGPNTTTPYADAATLFATFTPDPNHPRCARCKVLSPALDRWLARSTATAS